MSKAATREQMEELHKLVLETMLDYLKTTPPAKRRGSMLEVIRAFLKDNRIHATTSPDSLRSGLERLQYLQLPFPGNDSEPPMQ